MQETIESTLQETTSRAIDELKDLLKEYWIENIDKEEICLSNDIDYDGRFHEMVDSSVPIYTHELKSNYFMHEDELEQALEISGCYCENERPDNFIAVCHYFYIEQACRTWWNDNYQEIEDKITERRDELLDTIGADAIGDDFVEHQLKDFINNMEI